MRIVRPIVVLGAVIVATLSLGLAPAAAPPACTWTGTPGPDEKHGTPGDDVLCGMGGDDKLYGAGGNDRLRGGWGDDFLTGEARQRHHLRPAGSGTPSSDAAGTTGCMAGTASTTVTAASGATCCSGVPAATSRSYGGSAGADRVYGGDGNDACVTTIDGSGNDAVFGGPGIDHYWSDPGDERDERRDLRPLLRGVARQDGGRRA